MPQTTQTQIVGYITSERYSLSTVPTVAPGCRAPTSMKAQIHINFSNICFWKASLSRTWDTSANIHDIHHRTSIKDNHHNRSIIKVKWSPKLQNKILSFVNRGLLSSRGCRHCGVRGVLDVHNLNPAIGEVVSAIMNPWPPSYKKKKPYRCTKTHQFWKKKSSTNL